MKNAKKLFFLSALAFVASLFFTAELQAQTRDSDPNVQAIQKFKKVSNDLWDQIAHLDPGDNGYDDGQLKMHAYQLMISNLGTYGIEDARMMTILELGEGSVDEEDYQTNNLDAELLGIKNHIDSILNP